MKTTNLSFLLATLFVFAACSPKSAEEKTDESAASSEALPAAESGVTGADVVVIEPGLTMRILQEGTGAVAKAGQMVSVHYTGWLHDSTAENARGSKFDSSVDRDAHFAFSLGAGDVIQGWDKGVAGMKIGEVRELTIAPEMAYGQRAVGDLIPPGSTLVFEVSLAGLSGGDAAATE